MFGSGPYSGRSSSIKPSCSKTELNRCTATEIRWNKNEEARASPVISGRICNFQRHMTLTLTLDRATWHTIMYHSSTSTYTKFHLNRRNFLWTDGRTSIRTDGRTDIEAGFIRLTQLRSLPKKTKEINSVTNDNKSKQQYYTFLLTQMHAHTHALFY